VITGESAGEPLVTALAKLRIRRLGSLRSVLSAPTETREAREEQRMTTIPTPIRTRRELAHREADGIEVTLFWHPRSDSLTVEVFDRGVDAFFELDVAPDDALEAFNHPYFYAARTGVTYELPSLDAA
jgi:hypothetical protein